MDKTEKFILDVGTLMDELVKEPEKYLFFGALLQKNGSVDTLSFSSENILPLEHDALERLIQMDMDRAHMQDDEENTTEDFYVYKHGKLKEKEE